VAAGGWLGLDVGGTKILGVVLDDAGTVVAEDRVPTPAGAAAILDAAAGLCLRLQELAGPATGVGIGTAGLVDRGGVVRVSPNLPGVSYEPFADGLAGRLGVEVAADNDATCAAWGEFRLGAARGTRDAVVLTLGTGIGGGLITNGALVRGASGFAGEPGHMVVDPNGPPCPCGRRGCWERYGSGSGLGKLAREAAVAGLATRVVELAGGDPEDVRGEHVTAAAAEGDEQALAVMERFGWWIALGVANLVNVLDPEVVVLGGGLAAAGDLVLDPTRVAFGNLVMAANHRPRVAILVTVLGPRAGAVGAALLGRDRARGREAARP
jgi:glucokinase